VLGLDHRHTFPVYPISDAVMIRMMADENSDAWSNQVRHGNLVVSVARDYLDNLFDQHETLDNLSQVAEFSNVAGLFQTNSQYQQVRHDGADGLLRLAVGQSAASPTLSISGLSRAPPDHGAFPLAAGMPVAGRALAADMVPTDLPLGPASAC
jgi:hypothetical protein